MSRNCPAIHSDFFGAARNVAVEGKRDLGEFVRSAVGGLGERLLCRFRIEPVLVGFDGPGTPGGIQVSVGRQLPERISPHRVSRSIAYANASRTFLSVNGSWVRVIARL